LPFARPELFAKGNLLKPPSGILLCGPPGTGKTMLAKAIAKETKAVFINLQISTLEDMWFGESQQLVRAVFTLATKLQPIIIFIDEIDGLLGTRHSNQEHHAVRNMKSEFMNLWDGVNTNKNSYIIIIGATNRPQDIDPAFMRRMPLQLTVDLPNMAERKHILQIILEDEDVEEGLNFETIAKQTEQYSGSDLKELCRQAAYARVRDYLKTEMSNTTTSNTSNKNEQENVDEETGNTTHANLRKITMNDFMDALTQNKEKDKQSHTANSSTQLLQKILDASRNFDNVFYTVPPGTSTSSIPKRQEKPTTSGSTDNNNNINSNSNDKKSNDDFKEIPPD